MSVPRACRVSRAPSNFGSKFLRRYSFAEVVFFDPMDPATIYGTLRVPDNEQGRALVEKERARIVADYDLIDDETRIRSQRGAKEHFAEGLKSRRALYRANAKNISRRRAAGGAGLFALGRIVFQRSRALGCRRCRHVAVHAGNRQEIHAHR